MRITSLKSPGIYSNGQALRHQACRAISMAEITARKTPGGKTASAAKLRDFFLDCADKLTAIALVPDVTAPTIASAVTTTDQSITVTFAEAMEQVAFTAGLVEIKHDSVLMPITGQSWTNATTLVLTTSATMNTGEVVQLEYFAANPGDTGIYDLAGNELAAGVTAVTNTIGA